MVYGADGWWWPNLAVEPRSDLAISSVLLTGAMLYLAGQLHYSRRIPFWTELRAIGEAAFVAMLGSGFIQFSLQRQDSRLMVAISWMLWALFLLAFRHGARSLLGTMGLWQIRALVVGDGEQASQAVEALGSERMLGYVVTAVVPSPAVVRDGSAVWRDLMRHHRANLLVLAHQGAEEQALSLLREGIPVAVVPQTRGLPVHGWARTSFLSHDTVLLTYDNSIARPAAQVTKMALDLSAAVLLLLLMSPFLLVIAAAVSLDGGPIIYAHRRVGAAGRPFDCLKFRSMVQNSDEALRRLLASNPAAAAEWAATQKLRRDPRITRIGRFLRATSLDEVPQLFNVLRLEMSLVGPRPIVQAEVPRYGDDICYYYNTRPGLTGLWQVSGRSDTSFTDRVRLDAWYVKNWCIWHDLAILAKTVPAVLRREGAV